MPKKIYKDINIGDKYGKWTVIDKIESNKYERKSWLCQCACGRIKKVDDTTLKRGKSLSCGKCRENVILKQSFYDWCIENNRKDLLNRWDYELNRCSPKNIGIGNRNSFYFKCPKGIHESELKKMIAIIHNGVILDCHKCNSFAQYLIDRYGQNALDMYWDYNKNTINPWDISCQGNYKVWIKCQEKDYHGSYLVYCNNFYRGHRCSYCSHQKVHPLESLGALYLESVRYWSDVNKKSPFQYNAHSNSQVYWKCPNNKHEIYQRSINTAVRFEFRCPECSRERKESMLQEKVRKYLEINYSKYKLNHEYSCTLIPQNPKFDDNRYKLPFDNELIIGNKHLIIEVMGQQHYKEHSYNSIWNRKDLSPKQALHKQKLYDRYKRYVAYKNGYEYIAISYLDIEKSNKYKTIIDNKIKEIDKM